MLLPYRAKNPPEHPPYVTIALIVINVLIFLFTSDSFLVVRRDIVDAYAVSHETLSFLRLTTSMFLHGSILHLAGNMLALWLFGASVEGRLRPLKFLGVYMLAGYAGGLLHDFMVGVYHPMQFGLGASGAIMGLSGAYLYIFPYSYICTYVGIYFSGGVREIQARWIVLIYVGFDLLNAIGSSGGGVAHFAHLGGFGMGLLSVWLLRTPRDSEEASIAQSELADVNDYSQLTLMDLESLMQRQTQVTDLHLVMAYCEKAVLGHHGHAEPALQVLRQYGTKLIVHDEYLIPMAQVLLHIPPQMGGMHSVFYLRLASQLEAKFSYELASQVYHRILELAPNDPDSEVALYRLGRLMVRGFHNAIYARQTYHEQLRRFPNGRMAEEARRALTELDGEQMIERPR